MIASYRMTGSPPAPCQVCTNLCRVARSLHTDTALSCSQQISLAFDGIPYVESLLRNLLTSGFLPPQARMPSAPALPAQQTQTAGDGGPDEKDEDFEKVDTGPDAEAAKDYLFSVDQYRRGLQSKSATLLSRLSHSRGTSLIPPSVYTSTWSVEWTETNTGRSKRGRQIVGKTNADAPEADGLHTSAGGGEAMPPRTGHRGDDDRDTVAANDLSHTSNAGETHFQAGWAPGSSDDIALCTYPVVAETLLQPTLYGQRWNNEGSQGRCPRPI